MDLAFATGRGPELLTNLEGLRPLVRDEDIVAFGFRDAQEQREYGSQPLPPDRARIDCRKCGGSACSRPRSAPSSI